MKVGDELIEDKKEIASNLNSFFVEKVKRISEGIPDTNTDPLNYTRTWTEQFVRIPEMRLRRVVRFTTALWARMNPSYSKQTSTEEQG